MSLSRATALKCGPDGIKKHCLFEDDSVKRQSVAAKKLSLRLLHFIASTSPRVHVFSSPFTPHNILGLQGTDPIDTDLDETSFPVWGAGGGLDFMPTSCL